MTDKKSTRSAGNAKRSAGAKKKKTLTMTQSYKGIKAGWVQLTESLCGDLLAKVPEYQRNIKTKRQEKIVRDLLADKWETNGETIKIGKSGALLDGQNRLHSFIKAGVFPKVLFVIGIEEEEKAYSTIDLGSPRNTADALKMHGVKKGTVIASALNAIAMYYNSDSLGWSWMGKGSVTINEAVEVYEEYKDRIHYWDKQFISLRTVVPHARLIAVSCIAENYYEREDIYQFWDGVATNIGPETVQSLRKVLTRDAAVAGRKGRMGAPLFYAFLVIGLKAYMEDVTVKKFEWTTRQFPRFDAEEFEFEDGEETDAVD